VKRNPTTLPVEIDTDWLKFKDHITKPAEKIIGYKKWKNRKWLLTWNDEIQRTVEETKLATGSIYKTKQ
jgi:hypothetical protein